MFFLGMFVKINICINLCMLKPQNVLFINIFFFNEYKDFLKIKIIYFLEWEF